MAVQIRLPKPSYFAKSKPSSMHSKDRQLSHWACQVTFIKQT